jgi:hypothetical protein
MNASAIFGFFRPSRTATDGLLQRDRQPSAFKRRMVYRYASVFHLHLPIARKAFDRNLLGLSSFY